MLLDTHVLVWLLDDDRRLGRKARSSMIEGIDTRRVVLSAATIYELTWLVARGRLVLRQSLLRLLSGLASSGVAIEPVSAEAASAAALLKLSSQDPFDRMILGTAVICDVPLMTANEKLLGAAATYAMIDARL